jgi:hypothetical protein
VDCLCLHSSSCGICARILYSLMDHDLDVREFPNFSNEEWREVHEREILPRWLIDGVRRHPVRMLDDGAGIGRLTEPIGHDRCICHLSGAD